MRSARKNDAPLRTPRRKISALPASLRMPLPSLAIRFAICFSLNSFLTRFFNENLVLIASAGDLECFRDLHAGDAYDFVLPDEKRNSVAGLDRDFTINQKILQLFLLRHPQRLEPIARPSISHDERWIRSSR